MTLTTFILTFFVSQSYSMWRRWERMVFWHVTSLRQIVGSLSEIFLPCLWDAVLAGFHTRNFKTGRPTALIYRKPGPRGPYIPDENATKTANTTSLNRFT